MIFFDSFFFDRCSPLSLSELSDDESGNGSDSSQDQSWQITFPELDAHIRRVIIKYEGAVFPKLNWSSPQVSSFNPLHPNVYSYLGPSHRMQPGWFPENL